MRIKPKELRAATFGAYARITEARNAGAALPEQWVRIAEHVDDRGYGCAIAEAR